MFDIKGFFKKRQEGKLEEARRAHEQVRLAFTRRYLNFKTLLSLNDKVLEIINAMEQALEGRDRFGLAFVRAQCTALSVNLYKIIQSLNAISEERYQNLYPVFDRIWNRIDQVLKKEKNIDQRDWVLPLQTVHKDLYDLAGNKMANLGEIRNRLGLPVPDGFVITTAAYDYFMGKSHLQEEINRRLQFLEPSDMAGIHEASSEIQKLVINAPFPPELEEAINSAYQALSRRIGADIRVSLRSSALGEDAQEASFAGQYRSLLNISREYLILSYKEIAASKYSVPAIAYRLNKGFLDEDIVMGVGCMAMVRADTAGVMYSADPGGGNDPGVVINAVPGLGKSVVDGSIIPDLFIVDPRPPGRIIKREIQEKTKKFVCDPEEGICLEMLTDGEKMFPAIRDEQALALAGMAERLESHFGCPQDIEWAIEPEGSIVVLQSRPLLILEKESSKKISEPEISDKDHPLLLQGGITASPGAACGPVFFVEHTVDMLRFPPGSILVARNPLPQWAALLSTAAAVVTEQGALTGHLAAVAREFKVPALMGLQKALQSLKPKELITVDASHHKIYTGRVESLLQNRSKIHDHPLKGSPVYLILENILKLVAPLFLTDPESETFSPENCRTLHDIIRFAHEMALRELFDPTKGLNFSEKFSKKLMSNLPMEWYVIDLEGGIRPGQKGRTIGLEDILSRPLLALWEGLKAVPWKGPPPVDTRGFMAILAESTMDRSLNYEVDSEKGAKNYALVSENFCHLSTRLGFHFSTVEAFMGDLAAENYIWFYFKGGAADRVRKEQRSLLIQTILEKFHFWVRIKGDMLSARLERQEKKIVEERLKVIGYLILHTRQLDMVLSDPGKVERQAEKMLEEIGTFLEIP